MILLFLFHMKLDHGWDVEEPNGQYEHPSESFSCSLVVIR